jgi:hypothetical protein
MMLWKVCVGGCVPFPWYLCYTDFPYTWCSLYGLVYLVRMFDKYIPYTPVYVKNTGPYIPIYQYIFRSAIICLFFMLFSGLLIYRWKLYLIISQWNLSKYNFTLLNDETTFLRFSPCGTSILFLLTIPTMSSCLQKSKTEIDK